MHATTAGPHTRATDRGGCSWRTTTRTRRTPWVGASIAPAGWPDDGLDRSTRPTRHIRQHHPNCTPQPSAWRRRRPPRRPRQTPRWPRPPRLTLTLTRKRTTRMTQIRRAQQAREAARRSPRNLRPSCPRPWSCWRRSRPPPSCRSPRTSQSLTCSRCRRPCGSPGGRRTDLFGGLSL